MRIEPHQTIAGHPARLVRQLMRETLGREITPRWVAEVLGCQREDVEVALANLEREGWVCRVRGHLEPSLQGSALAQATAAKPLTRATAERLVAEVFERVDAVNRGSKYAYRIDKALVFGSYLNPEARPNDVDFAVRLVPRYSGIEQQAAEERRRSAHRSDFRNTFEWAAWPKLEVLKFLKSRSRGLSVQEITDFIEGQDHRVLLDAGVRKEAVAG